MAFEELKGEVCAAKFKEKEGYPSYSEREALCNGLKGHEGDHSSHYDCCGDRYPCYATARNCEFCGHQNVLCTSCLQDHERECGKRKLALMEQENRTLRRRLDSDPLARMD